MNSKELIKALRKGEISIESYKELLANKANETAVVEKKKSALAMLNEQETPFASTQCIHEIFDEIARKFPNKTAVIHQEASISYAKLHEKSTAVALQLQKRGVQPDDSIGIFLERSVETIIAMLGILKAGAAFLPIDTAYPEARVA
jgi:non-ribosomal peptide synthetase component F